MVREGLTTRNIAYNEKRGIMMKARNDDEGRVSIV